MASSNIQTRRGSGTAHSRSYSTPTPLNYMWLPDFFPKDVVFPPRAYSPYPRLAPFSYLALQNKKHLESIHHAASHDKNSYFVHSHLANASFTSNSQYTITAPSPLSTRYLHIINSPSASSVSKVIGAAGLKRHKNTSLPSPACITFLLKCVS